MTPVTHGGLQPEELRDLGIDPIDVLDLSANLNPFGVHADVLLAARDADVRRYPPADAAPLRGALARAADLDVANVLVTAGATSALHVAVRALLPPGEACLLWPPTFGEYEAAVAAAGGHTVEVRAAPPDFAPDLEVGPAPLAVLCNPNNPTGVYLDRHAVEELVARLGGGTLILDVAYDAFVEGAWDADDLVRAGLPVVVVHSMTKLHAAPGLRVGYVVASFEMIARLAAAQPSWPVGAAALAAGLAMVTVEPQQRRALAEVTRVREFVSRALARGGLEVAPSRANFALVRVGDAAAFRRRLLGRGFAVRDCASFGLPEWVRVAMPVEAAARRLVTAFLASHEETASS
jgi:histidinol-phosphate/aromatic aminotransferase/cobyric acid decarboxylase-like protein